MVDDEHGPLGPGGTRALTTAIMGTGQVGGAVACLLPCVRACVRACVRSDPLNLLTLVSFVSSTKRVLTISGCVIGT